MQRSDPTDNTRNIPEASRGPAPHGRSDAVAVTADVDHAESEAVGELEKYLAHLAHLDMALPMKIELIRSLHAIMQSFVDRAFGDDPVQQALYPESKSIEMADPNLAPMIELNITTDNQTEDLSTAFRDPAAGAAGGK